MKVTQVIEVGPVKGYYVSSFHNDQGYNELEFQFEGAELKTSMSEDFMKRLHKALTEKLTTLAQKRANESEDWEMLGVGPQVKDQ